MTISISRFGLPFGHDIDMADEETVSLLNRR